MNQFERLIIRLNVLIWYYLCSTAIFFPCNHFTAGGIVIMLCSIKTVFIGGCYLVCFSPNLYLGLLPPGLGWVWRGVSVLRTRQERLPRITGIDWLSDWMIDWPTAWPMVWLICWTHCFSIRINVGMRMRIIWCNMRIFLSKTYIFSIYISAWLQE